MQIKRIHEIELSASDDAKIGALMDMCFDTEFDGRSFFQQRHHLRLFIRSEDAIIAHMALDLRAIRIGGTLRDVMGLAEVATAPTHRGKGLASRLMSAAIDEAKASPADFFVLFGDRPLYAGQGFSRVANDAIYVTMEGAKTGQVVERPTNALMMLPLSDKTWDETAVVDLMGHKF